MNRRELLQGIAAATAASQAVAQTQTETLYVPPAQRVQDLALLQDTMEEYPFVELVTATPSLRITHLPVWLDRKAGAYGTLHGHIARNNPQTAAIEAATSAVIAFRGPHAYISPTWYTNPKTVPTWNFAAVHVSGKLEPVVEQEPLYNLLSTLIARSEGKYGGGYDFSKIPRSFTDGLMKGIIGFRMPIAGIEGKFKLGQERSEADRTAIVSHLRSAAGDRNIAEFTASYYKKRHPPSSTNRG